MQQVKISTVVAILVTGVLLGTAVDAMLNVGDAFIGNVQLGQADVVEFEGLAGEKFTGSVKASKGQSLIPNLKLIAPDGSTVAEGFGQKKKFALKKIELPMTGVYQLEIGGQNNTFGDYKLTTKSKIGKTITKKKNDSSIGPKQVQDTDFDSKSETEDRKNPTGPLKTYLLNGTIKTKKKKSSAVPFNPVVYAPSAPGSEGKGDPLELTGFITKNNKGVFKIKNLVLPDLGTYTLEVENSGLSGVINTSLQVKKPKIKKQTITKDI